jgi:hypothetical protein
VENSETIAPSGPAWNPGDVQVNLAPAAPEGFLLARVVAELRVDVLGADLPWEEHQFLRADTIGVHVDDDFRPDFLEASDAVVADLDPLLLLLREGNARPRQHRQRRISCNVAQGVSNQVPDVEYLIPKVERTLEVCKKAPGALLGAGIERGFRRFSQRGLAKVRNEWAFVCLTHNLIKLFRYTTAQGQRQSSRQPAKTASPTPGCR